MEGPREPDRPVKNKTKQEIDDFLYELRDTGMPTLELGDKLIDTLGTEAEDLFNSSVPPTKKEQEDEVLKNIIDEYNIGGMKNTIGETGQVPENIYFFYVGDSQQFVDALEFIGLSSINREFATFLLSELGRQTMTQNKLSIHVETGDIFYDNHNTEETFIVFYYLNKTMKRPMFLKNVPTTTVLRNISRAFYRCFRLMIKKNSTF